VRHRSNPLALHIKPYVAQFERMRQEIGAPAWPLHKQNLLTYIGFLNLMNEPYRNISLNVQSLLFQHKALGHEADHGLLADAAAPAGMDAAIVQAEPAEQSLLNKHTVLASGNCASAQTSVVAPLKQQGNTITRSSF